MNSVNIFLKKPISFEGKFLVYPPSVNEVLDNNNFNQYQQALTISQEELEDLFVDKMGKDGQPIEPPTPLEFLIGNAYYNKEFLEIVKEAFRFFLHQETSFLFNEKAILVGDLEQSLLSLDKLEDLQKFNDNMILLNEKNYFDFQNLIREVLGLEKVTAPNPNEDIRVKRIKAKARLRDRVKAKRGNGITLEDSLVSICCMGIGLNPLNIGEISYAAVSNLMRRYQEKEKYDIDIKSLLAGADSKKVKPKYWIRRLDKN